MRRRAGVVVHRAATNRQPVRTWNFFFGAAHFFECERETGFARPGARSREPDQRGMGDECAELRSQCARNVIVWRGNVSSQRF